MHSFVVRRRKYLSCPQVVSKISQVSAELGGDGDDDINNDSDDNDDDNDDDDDDDDDDSGSDDDDDDDDDAFVRCSSPQVSILPTSSQ